MGMLNVSCYERNWKEETKNGLEYAAGVKIYLIVAANVKRSIGDVNIEPFVKNSNINHKYIIVLSVFLCSSGEKF